MSWIETVFFDYDGTLVDNEATYSRTYVTTFQEFDITLDPEEVFRRFKGVRLYEIVDIVSLEHGVTLAKTEAEHIRRTEAARLFDSGLEAIKGAGALLSAITASMCVVSNDPNNKMQHSIGRLNMLYYLLDRLFSGYDIQHWKPDPALVLHTAKAMNVNVGNYVLVDDSVVGAQSGIDIGMEVFYFYADPYNKPIAHPKIVTFIHLSQLPELWKTRGWDITTQSFTLSSFTPLKLALKGK